MVRSGEEDSGLKYASFGLPLPLVAVCERKKCAILINDGPRTKKKVRCPNVSHFIYINIQEVTFYSYTGMTGIIHIYFLSAIMPIACYLWLSVYLNLNSVGRGYSLLYLKGASSCWNWVSIWLSPRGSATSYVRYITSSLNEIDWIKKNTIHFLDFINAETKA